MKSTRTPEVLHEVLQRGCEKHPCNTSCNTLISLESSNKAEVLQISALYSVECCNTSH